MGVPTLARPRPHLLGHAGRPDRRVEGEGGRRVRHRRHFRRPPAQGPSPIVGIIVVSRELDLPLSRHGQVGIDVWTALDLRSCEGALERRAAWVDADDGAGGNENAAP
jgi:hypothetical protein